MRSWWVGLAVLALAVPGALAAAGQGTMEAADARLGGSVHLAATEGSARLVGNAADGLQLHAASLTIERVGERVVLTSGPVPAMRTDHHVQDIDETFSFSDATVAFAPGAAESLVGLRVVGTLDADLAGAAVRPVAGAFLAAINPDASHGACIERGCLDAHGTNEVLAPEGETRFAGDLLLVAVGPTIRVASAGETREFASGATSTPAGPFAEQRDNVRILLEAKGVEGALVHSDGTTWFVPRIEATAQSLDLDGAAGGLQVGLASYRASRERVHVQGALAAAIAPPPAGSYGASAGYQAYETAYAEGFTIRVSGDVASVSLRTIPVYERAPGGPIGLAALLAALAGLAIYLWPQIQFHATSALLPFYSRIQQPQVLENEVRHHIFDIICGNPGISAREVHRRSHQSWGTVVYHLRQLEKHHIVVSRSVGRTRNYYENHGKYRGMEVQLACLQSARARTLAHAVLTAPGITQEDLVASSGFPQPTTSYYVRKLKAAALVEERREGRYARYHPHAELARFLEIAESNGAASAGPEFAGVEG